MFKSGQNMFDFSNDDFRKIFDQKFWNFFLGGTPILAPQSAASPKMTTQCLWPHFFYWRIIFFFKRTEPLGTPHSIFFSQTLCHAHFQTVPYYLDSFETKDLLYPSPHSGSFHDQLYQNRFLGLWILWGFLMEFVNFVFTGG